MGLINITDISDGTGADGGDINSRMATLTGLLNGNIDNANIKAGGVATSNLATGSVTTDKIAAANVTADKLVTGGIGHDFVEIGRQTLSVASDTMTVTLPGFKYLRVHVLALATGGSITPNMTFNGDTGANYALRFSTNGGADSSTVSQSNIAGSSGTGVLMRIMDIINIAGQEKVAYITDYNSGTAGAANATSRLELTGKWANVTVQIFNVTITNIGVGDLAAGSELVVYGHN